MRFVDQMQNDNRSNTDIDSKYSLLARLSITNTNNVLMSQKQKNI